MTDFLVNIVEKYRARSGDEQKFMDKHTDNIEVTDAPGGEKGKEASEKMKKADRKSKRQGYSSGEDEDVYEQCDITEESLFQMIDESIEELSEELTQEEYEILCEMVSSPDAYRELIESILSEEDEDEDEDDDEDDDDDVIETSPKRKKMAEASYDRDLDEKKPVVAKGVKGMSSKSFTKKFRNLSAYEKWADSDAADDFEIRQVMNA